MFNLATVLEDSARNVPDRDAVVLGDTRLTYAQVEAAASQVANLLVDTGLRPGDKVALSCPNLPYFPIVYYGVLKMGGVVVPLNVLLKGREIAYHLDDSDAKAYFCFDGTAELPMGQEGWKAFQDTDSCEHFFLITADPGAASPIDGAKTMGQAVQGVSTAFDSVVADETDTAVILYTSGTTGQPKGAELSHANIIMNCKGNERLFGYPDDFDVYLCVLPLFHSFGQTVIMNTGFGLGATLVLLPRFEAGAALQLMQREDITFFAGVPTMYWGLLSALDDDTDVDRIAHNLRIAVAGGASLPVEIIKDFRDRFHVDIKEGYGLSETSPVATFTPPGAQTRPGSIGKPIWGVQCRLVDTEWNETPQGEVGEIAIKGHNVMKGYYQRPDETAAVMHEGWFRTGDLATVDDEGWYYIVDRVKDLIIRGGFNVYPREVEEVLMTHPAVSLAAVIGIPEESHGEEVKAFVIKNEGDDTSEDELIAWAKDEMAGHKYPRVVEFVKDLPMTSTGKILKRELH